MASWIPIEDGSDFSLQNLPYGVFSTDDLDQRIGVAIGDYVLDLKALAQEKVFAAIDFDSSTLEEPTINAYASLRKSVHHDVRKLMQDILSESTLLGPVLRDHRDRRDRVLVPLSRAKMHMPMHIGDYTDFFVGLYHAQNVCGNPRLMIFLDALAIANAGGKCCDIFRPGMGLPPNFSSLPVGYHGRASSVVISGTPVHRPRGQIVLNGIPTESLCQKLDFEVEFAAFIGRGNKMGSRIGVNEAEDHIFGVVLMNDWSARDIQQWESTPLGPFNGKNFCTTISPWIVTLEALEPFRTTPLTVG